MNIDKYIILIFSLLFPALSFADQEASNRPHVVASEWGGCYAKSVPDESYGQKGTTKVYNVKANEDELVTTHDWYSGQIYLHCNVSDSKGNSGISTVRLGPWQRGREVNKDDLAIAFYLNDKLLKRYSTLDIAQEQKNASASVSHYTVIKNTIGYKRTQAGLDKFLIETEDGRKLSFLGVTGELVPEQVNGSDQQLFFNAIESMGIEKVKELLNNKSLKIDINAKNQDEYSYYYGLTPLHIAINVSQDIAKFLLENGADVNALNHLGETPLHRARNNDQFMPLLLEHGADPNIKGSYEKESVIHQMAKNGNTEAVTLLLKYKADINSTDTYGQTPLHDAASGYYGHKVLQLLIDKGAKVNAKNNFGQTPLHHAANYGQPETVKILLKNGADIEAKDKDGKTPLDVAKKRKDEAILESFKVDMIIKN